MSRRGLASLRVILYLAIVGLLVYGYYSYHELQSDLKLRDQREERVKRQLDTVSAELETLYEQKTSFEKSLKDELSEHKRVKDELEREKQTVELNCINDKQDLNKRIEAISSESKRLQVRNEDLEHEISKLQEKDTKLEDDKNKIEEQYKQEYMQLKNEQTVEINKFQDQIVELGQQKSALENQLSKYRMDYSTLVQQKISLENQLSKLQTDYSAAENQLTEAKQLLSQLQLQVGERVKHGDANVDSQHQKLTDDKQPANEVPVDAVQGGAQRWQQDVAPRVDTVQHHVARRQVEPHDSLLVVGPVEGGRPAHQNLGGVAADQVNKQNEGNAGLLNRLAPGQDHGGQQSVVDVNLGQQNNLADQQQQQEQEQKQQQQQLDADAIRQMNEPHVNAGL